MRATDIILKKRGTFVTEKGNRILKNSEPLTKEEIDFMIKGCTDESIPQYQLSSWLMSIFFNGMTFEETAYLTQSMLYSGDVINLHKSGLFPENTVFVDKHSTGGVGDKISLPLAPIVAACGLKVPMMSGRALGHTGGTLDKLESIKGYNVNLTEEKFTELINSTGFAMTGQTKKIAPADRILYALRDVTGTVESIPLITASILSKKVAEGSDALVFDVKYGTGAFMKSKEDAENLATSLVKTVKAMGKDATAFLTDMNTPLGLKIGNFLEIEETIDCLMNKGPSDVMELTCTLGAEMLVLGKIARSTEEGLEMCKKAVESGKALEIFLKNVKDQGGDPDFLLKEKDARRSPFHYTFTAEEDGYISMESYLMGIAGVALGVGRTKTTDPVCPDAGMILFKKTGDLVKKGEPLMEVYGKDENSLSESKTILSKAVTYSAEKPETNPLIYKIIR